jgi:hypothetical protein
LELVGMKCPAKSLFASDLILAMRVLHCVLIHWHISG